MNRRLLIFILCYLFSAVGILLTIQISAEELRRISWSSVGILVWWLCWGLHIFMGINWVMNKPPRPLIAKISLGLLVLSLLYIPLQGVFLGIGSLFTNIASIALILILEVTFTFPAIGLAIYLYKYNLKSKSAKNETPG